MSDMGAKNRNGAKQRLNAPRTLPSIVVVLYPYPPPRSGVARKYGAFQPTIIGGCRRRVKNTANNTVAESCAGFAAGGTHGHLLARGHAPAKRVPRKRQDVGTKDRVPAARPATRSVARGHALPTIPETLPYGFYFYFWRMPYKIPALTATGGRERRVRTASSGRAVWAAIVAYAPGEWQRNQRFRVKYFRLQIKANIISIIYSKHIFSSS